jgi:protein SSD1
MLHELSVEMRKQRYAGGSLSMNSVKLQFELDDQGQPISVSTFEAQAANRLIEEFMLRANISVAEKISKTFRDESLLRRHEDPLEKRLVSLVC